MQARMVWRSIAQQTRIRSGRTPNSRGVALLLVLIAMTSATVLAGSYLVSRRNSPGIGANVLRSAQARWAAKSAAEYALAALQTNINWFDADPTTLMPQFSFGDAMVTVYVTNMAGNTPAPIDTDLVIVALATVNGVTVRAEQLVSYKSGFGTNQAFDPRLGEFAVYTMGQTTVDSTAMIFPWSASPNYHAGRPVKVGGAYTSSFDAAYDPNAAVLSAGLYVPDTATLSLQALIGQQPFETGGIVPSLVRVAPAPLPASFATLPLASPVDDWVMSSSDAGRLDAGVHQSLHAIGANSIVTLDAAKGSDYSFNDLHLMNQAVLFVKGDVRIHVQGDLWVLSGSDIELDKKSTLKIFTDGDVIVDDAAIGFGRKTARDAARSVNKVEGKYLPANQVQLLGLRRNILAIGPATYQLGTNSLARMVVHAPMADVSIQTNSAIFGKVTGDTLDMGVNAVIAYDTALDKGVGVTEKKGPLYDTSGALLPQLQTLLATFDPSVQTAEDLRLALLADPTLSAFPVDTLAQMLTIPTATKRDPRRAVARSWPSEALAFEASAATVATKLPWAPGVDQITVNYLAAIAGVPTTPPGTGGTGTTGTGTTGTGGTGITGTGTTGTGTTGTGTGGSTIIPTTTIIQ